MTQLVVNSAAADGYINNIGSVYATVRNALTGNGIAAAVTYLGIQNYKAGATY